jgi:DNA-binding transcriptional LysR family regulator
MWNNLRCFIVSVEKGSFTEAAKELNISIATVSRRIDSLEKTLQLRLFNRLVTGVELTAEGIAVYKSVSSAAVQIAQLERLAASLREEVDTEPVVISSTEPIISGILAPNLKSFIVANPKIRLTLSVATDNVSLSYKKADIVVRLTRPTPDNVMMKRLPEIRQSLYASKKYLEGKNRAKINLANESLLGMDQSFGDIPETQWFIDQGLSNQLVLKSSSIRALFESAKSGCGIALLPDYIAETAGLIRIDSAPIQKRIPYLAFHRDFRKVKRIKLTRNWIVKTFNEVLRY